MPGKCKDHGEYSGKYCIFCVKGPAPFDIDSNYESDGEEGYYSQPAMMTERLTIQDDRCAGFAYIPGVRERPGKRKDHGEYSGRYCIFCVEDGRRPDEEAEAHFDVDSAIGGFGDGMPSVRERPGKCKDHGEYSGKYCIFCVKGGRRPDDNAAAHNEFDGVPGMLMLEGKCKDHGAYSGKYCIFCVNGR